MIEPTASISPAALSAHEFPKFSPGSPTILEVFVFVQVVVLYRNICILPLF